MQKILLLEDDRNLNRGISLKLEKAGGRQKPEPGDFIKIRKRRISGIFRLFRERGGRAF